MSNEKQNASEAPQLTGKEQFQRRGFKSSAEVIAEMGSGEAPEAPQETLADPEIAQIIAMDPNVALETAEGVALPDAPAEEEAQSDAEEAIPSEEGPKYRIGSREFTKQEEAWAYAEQLEQERLAADAFRQGVEAAAKINPGNLAPQPPPPPEPQEIDPEYYTNPKAYFAKREAEIIAKADQVIEQKRRQRETHDTTWNQFYTDYPDLSSAREFVDLTLQQNWTTLQHVETKQALKQLADKVREKLKPIIESRMPKTELPKVKTAASPGGAKQVTSTKEKPQVLTLTQQMKNLKKSRAHF